MATTSRTNKKATAGTDNTADSASEQEYTVYTGPDSFSVEFIKKLDAMIAQFLDINGQLAAADGDEEKAIASFIDGSDDAKMAELRAVIEKARLEFEAATNAAKEYAASQIKSVTLTDDEKNKKREELKALREKVSLAETTTRNAGEMFGVDVEGVNTAVDTLMAKMPKARRGKQKGDKGSTLPRAYCSLEISGGNMEKPVTFTNFSRASIGLNADVESMQRAFAKAAGVEWENIKTVEKSVTFEFSPDEKRTYTIVTTPTAKPGRKKGDTATTTADTASDAKTDSASESTDTSAAAGNTSAA